MAASHRTATRSFAVPSMPDLKGQHAGNPPSVLRHRPSSARTCKRRLERQAARRPLQQLPHNHHPPRAQGLDRLFVTARVKGQRRVSHQVCSSAGTAGPVPVVVGVILSSAVARFASDCGLAPPDLPRNVPMTPIKPVIAALMNASAPIMRDKSTSDVTRAAMQTPAAERAKRTIAKSVAT